MVAVGTRVTPRSDPYVPNSGIRLPPRVSDGELTVCAPAPVTRLPGSVPGPCFAGSHSPWPPPFAPPTPQRIAPPCSSASQLLRRSLTPHVRSSSATAPRLPDADLVGTWPGRTWGLPVNVQRASADARICDHAGPSGHSRYRAHPFCLPSAERRRHPGRRYFRGSMAGLCVPLSTLRCCPRRQPRMTRGRCGSLLPHRDGLAPSTPCRSPGALRNTSNTDRKFSAPVTKLAGRINFALVRARCVSTAVVKLSTRDTSTWQSPAASSGHGPGMDVLLAA
jgi:hypothetical protein